MSARFSALRMLADDLTGALDTAAQFAAAAGRLIQVVLDIPENPLPDTLVIDCATREATAIDAATKARRAAATLDTAPGRLSFFKVDSLLRGHPVLELAECLKQEPHRRCMIAPALPHQKRVTRAGKQYACFSGQWTPVGPDITAQLSKLGFSCTLARPGDPVPLGISLWDSESDADIDAIVQAGMACETEILWCGSAGLAGGLARTSASHAVPGPLPGPFLGIFGSDHAVMRGQLAHDAAFCVSSTDFKPGKTAWVKFDLPPGTDRIHARAMIDQMAQNLVADVPPPGTLVVSGGETLRGLARTLKIVSFDIIGQLEPGIPVARLVGGPWHGTPVISKSGAFGPPDFLSLLRQKASS